MSKTESIYYSYKNKSSVYYLTKSEEDALLLKKAEFIKTLSDEQSKKFVELEKCFDRYKDSLIKEIISYTVNYSD